MPLVILDGHNDLASRLLRGEAPRHIDLAAAAGSGFAGGFFALFAGGAGFEPPTGAPYSRPLEAPVGRAEALRETEAQAGILEGLDVTLVRRVEDLVPGRVGAIMHLEGAEPLAPDLEGLEGWYGRGLRSLGIVWSRRNDFGEGVPFCFPATPDTGPGLTAAGIDLVHGCNMLGILVDVSHLNEAGFWDVAETTDAPLVATHSNAHALCASTRNLTDRQLDAIGESGGVVGVNFATGFLRADGDFAAPTALAEIVRHVDYIAARIGIDHVAFGSDFEGAEVPDELGGVAGLPRLVEALRQAGHDDASLEKITSANWLRVLGETWRPWGRYHERAGLDPRPTLLGALERFPEPGLAVDLGAGTGRDTLELLRRGWRVVAIDREADAIDRLSRHAARAGGELEVVVSPFETAAWPPCDLVNASYALPFCPRGSFPALWGRIVDSLGPGGRFAGQLFGERDEWARSGLVVQSRREVEALLAPFEIEQLDEFEGRGDTVVGPSKHWHLFHIVARKRIV